MLPFTPEVAVATDTLSQTPPAGLSLAAPIVASSDTLQRQDPTAPAGVTPFRAAVAEAVAYIDAHLVSPRELVVHLAEPYAYGHVRSELTAVANIAERHGIVVRLVGVSEPAREALRMTHLEHRFKFGEASR